VTPPLAEHTPTGSIACRTDERIWARRPEAAELANDGVAAATFPDGPACTPPVQHTLASKLHLRPELLSPLDHPLVATIEVRTKVGKIGRVQEGPVRSRGRHFGQTLSFRAKWRLCRLRMAEDLVLVFLSLGRHASRTEPMP
jgi:hypothetical protein